MISVVDKKDCCGCGMCASICPQSCIKIIEDNEGFVYPQFDVKMCTDCHLCEKTCPIINAVQVYEDREYNQKAYIVQHRDEAVLRESTSGGAFTAIAEYVLSNNGVVFGVALNKNLFARPSAARHVWIDDENDLGIFRNSKYIQSYLAPEVIKQVGDFLKCGRYVCFSGTPCQVEGLKRYLDVLRVDQTKLILVDVVCRAVPSPKIFRKYLEHQERKNSETIMSVRFRDKHYGYKYSTMNVISDINQGNYHRGVESDPWLRAFFSNICDRPSCHECKFRKINRVSDFTIWDCFHVGRFSKEMDNDKGATRVLVHTEKGQRVFEALRDIIKYEEYSVSKLVEGAEELKKSVKENINRKNFFIDANDMDGYTLFEKYFPENSKVKLKRIIRMFFIKLGIYDFAKKIYVRLTKKY